MDIYVARQPIFNSKSKVYAYELLFRSGPENFFPKVDPDMATSKLIDNSLFVMGLERLVGEKFAFINMTRNSLLSGLVSLLPRESVVIEILETVTPDAEVIASCRNIKDLGYMIALDDFIHDPSFEPLLDLADFVKVDFMATKTKERQLYAKYFLPRGIKMLAEKVETHEDVQEATDLGYSHFQGYFFCKPEIITGKGIPEYKINYLRFLQELSRPDLDFDALEGVIKQEVSLSIKLLRFLNSAAMGLRKEVTSIKHALVLLGERPLKKWASLIAFTNLADDKPSELLVTCLIRARFGELIGHNSGLRNRELDLFLLGMFSAVDAVVDRPLEDLLKEVPLPPDVQDTLLGGTTSLTHAYQLILAYEKAQWAEVTLLAKELKISEERIPKFYDDAVQWAGQIFTL